MPSPAASYPLAISRSPHQYVKVARTGVCGRLPRSPREAATLRAWSSNTENLPSRKHPGRARCAECCDSLPRIHRQGEAFVLPAAGSVGGWAVSRNCPLLKTSPSPKVTDSTGGSPCAMMGIYVKVDKGPVPFPQGRITLRRDLLSRTPPRTLVHLRLLGRFYLLYFPPVTA